MLAALELAGILPPEMMPQPFELAQAQGLLRMHRAALAGSMEAQMALADRSEQHHV